MFIQKLQVTGGTDTLKMASRVNCYTAAYSTIINDEVAQHWNASGRPNNVISGLPVSSCQNIGLEIIRLMLLKYYSLDDIRQIKDTPTKYRDSETATCLVIMGFFPNRIACFLFSENRNCLNHFFCMQTY